MPDGYFLPVQKARICRFASHVFMVVAVLWGIVMAAQAVVPGWTIACDQSLGCVQHSDVTVLLLEQAQALIKRNPRAVADLTAYVAHPGVRAGLAALILVREGLMVFLLIAIGRTLRHLGRNGEQVLARALPWLKHGSLAGVSWAIAQPLADMIRAVLLFPVTPSDALSLPVDLTVAGPALLLAMAAYAVAWALDAGVRAERDLASFV